AECQSHVLMIGVVQAVGLAGLSLRKLVGKTFSGEMHFHELADGCLLICLASLSRWLRRSNQPTLLLPPITSNFEEVR
ncbi:MAG: hypothetical protein ACRD82_10835, partial [Blastocatellia bacterium]